MTVESLETGSSDEGWLFPWFGVRGGSEINSRRVGYGPDRLGAEAGSISVAYPASSAETTGAEWLRERRQGAERIDRRGVAGDGNQGGCEKTTPINRR